MDVRMPDGTIISNVPDDITQSDLLNRYQLYSKALPTVDEDTAPGLPTLAQKKLQPSGEPFFDFPKQVFGSALSGILGAPYGAQQAIKGGARANVENIMPASVYNPNIDTEENIFGPETDKQKAQRKLMTERALESIPTIPGTKELNELGVKVQKSIFDTLSDKGKKALVDSQITGNIFKGELDFGKDPTVRGYALQAASVFGSLVPVLTTAIAFKSPTIGGLTGGAMAADEAANTAVEYIGKLNDDQLLQTSPFYAELIRGGADPKEARSLTIAKASESGAILQGLVATFGDRFTGKLVTGAFDSVIKKAAGKSILKNIGLKTALSAEEEGLQELAEGLASDVGIASVLPNKEIGEDSAANFFLGMLGGAGPGALSGLRRIPEEPIKPSDQVLKALKQAQKNEPAAPPAAPPISPIQEPPIAPVAPVAEEPVVTPPTPEELEAGPSQDKEAMLREIGEETPKAEVPPPKPTKLPPNFEVTHAYPMGENTEYQVLKTPLGYVANLYDKDSGKYVSGSARMYSTQTFGADAEIKANEFAQEQMQKAAKFTQPAPQTPTPPSNVSPPNATVATEPSQVKQVTPKPVAPATNLNEEKIVDAIKNASYKNNTWQGIPTTVDEFIAKNGRKTFDKAVEMGLLDNKIGDGRLFPSNKFVYETANNYYDSNGKKLKEPITPAPKAEEASQEPTPAQTPAEEAAIQRAPHTLEEIADKGEPVQTKQEAEKAHSDGDTVYGFHEQDEENPVLIKNIDDLKGFTPDQLLVVPKEAPAEETIIETAPNAEPFQTIAPSVQVDAAEKAKAQEDLDAALADLSMILTKGTRLNIMPEDEQKLMPVLTRLMDAAFRMGYYKFKEAAKFVLDYIRSKMGKQAADQISLDHLQGAYIGMAGKYADKGVSSKKDVIAIESLNELEESPVLSINTPDGQFKIAQNIAKYFVDGKGFGNINEARTYIGQLTGEKINPGTEQAKQADEAIEVGVVLAARQIIEQGGSKEQIYDKLVDLYKRQPNLAVRSSTSIANQAYSTPAPLAYVASELAGITKDSTVYEPTAGNGMLVIAATEKNITANELNPGRHAMLERILPKSEITNENALESKVKGNFDVVIENPPFGRVGEIGDIDHAIAMHSLEGMKEDGKAVLILGGVQSNTEEGRREGYRGKAKREFYFNLYNQYNVVDHFTAGGNMYAKQGTTYPVDIIVIDGKGKSQRDLPAAVLPRLITTYDQLKEKLNERPVVPRRNERPAGTNIVPSTEGEGGRGTVDTGISKPSGEPSTEGKQPTTGGKPSVPTTELTGSGQREPIGGGVSTKKPKPENVLKPITEPKPVSSTSETKPGSGKSTERNEPSGLGTTSVVSGERVESGLKNRAGEEQETANQVSYIPQSQANAVGTLMPKAMAESIENSLARLEDQFGNIDDFVAESLEMDPETLKQNFSAEQIDAIALAIKNAEEGKGFIIGDQTGVGKGRVVAAMIKFALIKDKIPIFLTEKPNLYSDMIRDLDDIGMTDQLGLDTNKIKILMTNNDEKVPYTLLRNVNGKITETNLFLKSGKMDGVLKSMIEKDDLGNYKVIFTTYNQAQTQKGAETERQRFLRHFGAGNYMIFDESHNAGGAGETQARTKQQKDAVKEGKSAVTGRAAFIRNLVQNAYGTFFSSATYAKRPDVMDLYSSTDMKLAVDKIADLANAIKNGGIPMQQTVAKMLTEVGQYIRRERTFAGVSYDTKETKVDKKTAENMATSMRDILAFSRAKETVVKEIQKSLDKSGSRASITTEKTTVQSANFGSIMHSLIDQMLLSLKAQEAANYAIEKLKANEKVVLTVSNTMGSFLKTYAEEMGIKNGEPVNLSFKDLYLKYLEKQRTITIKDPSKKDKDGNYIPIKHRLSDQELGPELTQQYNDVKRFIDNAGFSDAPVSPIDYIHDILRKANYKTDEITGRTLILNYAVGAPVLTSRNSDIQQRTNAVKAFNNGDLDVLILNQAGSTGLSLHAKSSFNDKRKRHMIIVQAEKNIDTHMQMLGRVHRTGQVMPPAYSQMMADIPAEMRPAAVLLKKMASLNANTTASRKSAVSAEGAVDFMNDYGGQIAQEYLRDNPEVYEAIGGSKALKLIEDSAESEEEDIKKLTGYIPILPIKQQEEVYKDLVERYNDLIEREDSMGTNKLEAKAQDLDAVTLTSKPITESKGEQSVFAQPAYMEKVDVKRTIKPFTKAEVEKQIEDNLDGKNKREFASEMWKDVSARGDVYEKERLDALAISGADPVKIETAKSQFNTQKTIVRTVLSSYLIGTPVSVKNSQGLLVSGVVTNIENKKKTKNPFAGSDWKIQIALANGDAKNISMNFSQINLNYQLKEEDETNWFNSSTQTWEKIPVIDLFDKGSTSRRENRWMVTGNLLAGYAAVDNMGQIISYTKDDGTTGQGILMPRIFDFEKAEKNAPVKLRSVDNVMAFLKEFYDGFVQTPDSLLRISKRGNNFTFTTSKSKREGGQYYNDKGLTDFTGDFYTRSGMMSATLYEDEKLQGALQYLLQEHGLVAGNNKEKAREIFAPKEEFRPGFQNITRGRNPELTIAAQMVQIGMMTKEDYDQQVKFYKPIHKYAKPPAPPSNERMAEVLDINKRKKINPDIKNGTRVGLRLDIPAWKEGKGERIVTIHTKAVPKRPGTVIGYDTVAKIKNVTFGLGDQSKALTIAAGANKDVLQTAEGEYVNITPEEAYAQAQEIFNSPEWTQIGVDPERHSYFYDRDTTVPVVAAEEVIQIGGFLMAKNVTYGNKENFLYNPYDGLNTEENLFTDREETIRRYQAVRQKRAGVLKKVSQGKFELDTQRELTELDAAAQDLKQAIDVTKPERREPKNFFTDATKAWDAGLISDDVYSAISTIYQKFPALLQDLKFSVKKGDGFAAGSYTDLARVVRLYKGTVGVTNPTTIRHEIVHSLEQMMDKDAANLLINNWKQALEAAIKNDKTEKGQKFFKALMDYYENPSKESYETALDLLPSYDYYQYINPSEYWAVNAEKLMARKLGTGWDRFVGAVKKLYEALKYMFGFNNQYVVHKIFDDIMSAQPQRFTKTMLIDYVSRTGIKLQNINTRRNYKGGPAPLPSWDSPNESKFEDDKWIYRLIDKNIDTKRVIQTINKAIGDIADRWDAYLAETLYHGRTAQQSESYLKNELRPLLEKMSNMGVSIDDFELYLHNRHAKEYNELVAARNPQMPDGGSGIFTQDALDYLNNLNKTPKKKKALETLAKDLDSTIKETQEILIKGGLETPETIDAWRAKMPFYVPLNRDPDELDFVNPGSGLGQGFATRGAFTKKATGSLKSVTDILANISLQRERAIVRSEKARVGRALYGLAIMAPNTKFWLAINPDAIRSKKKVEAELIAMGLRPEDAENIIQEPKVPGIDPKTGLVKYRVNPGMRNAPNVFPVRIDGKDRFIIFNPGDPRAKRMVEALKNLDAHQLSEGLGTIAEATRLIAAMNTQYNPVFGAWNFARDVGSATVNLESTAIAGKQAEVLDLVNPFKGIPALRAIYNVLRDRPASSKEQQKLMDLYKQFTKAGGQTGYREQFSRSKEKANIIQREMAKLDRNNWRKTADSMLDWLSDYNDAMENAVRLAAFKVALDEGMTEERAAELAKNLTVNFNRKGQWTANANALYAFFNASVQGTARMAELLVGKTDDGKIYITPAGKKIIAGGMLLGVTQAVILAMAGFDNDEPPEFLKNKNFIIPIGGKKYLIFPMPLGLNVFPNVARLVTEYALSGGKHLDKKLASVAGVILDAFNPLGSSGFAQNIAPTIIDPFVGVFATNKDAFGRPISKEDRANNPTPGYERSRENATGFSKGLAYGLNYITGGGKYGIGAVSPTGDQIDYLIQQYTGGVGRELMKIAETAKAPFSDEPLPTYRIPIVGKAYGETGSPVAVQDKFFKNVTALAEYENEIKRMRKDKQNIAEFRKEHPETKLISRANALENQISEINKRRKAMIERGAPKPAIDKQNETKTRLMTQFNEEMSKLQAQ